MTPRLWSALTTVAVVMAGAAASPAAAAADPTPVAPSPSAVATSAPAAVSPSVAPPAEAPPAEGAPAKVSPVEGPQATVTGELRRVSLADVDGTRTAISAVVTPDGDAVQVLSGDVADVPIGSTVTVTIDAAALDAATLAPDGGAAVSDLQVVETPTATITGPAAEAAAAPAPRDVHLLSGLLPGQTPAAIDLAPVVAAVANASDYFSTSTGGEISLAVASQRDVGTFAGWGDPATCDPDQVFALLDWAAQEAGILPAAGSSKHAVIQTPSFAACADLGLIADIDDGGAVWVNGATGAGELDPWALAQALGHTLGLGSSHARMDCVGLVDGWSFDCVDADLGSAYDSQVNARRQDAYRHARELEQTLQSAGLELSEQGLSFDLKQSRDDAQNEDSGRGGSRSASASDEIETTAPLARPIGLERWRGVRVDVQILRER